jgi:hypothetical protein
MYYINLLLQVPQQTEMLASDATSADTAKHVQRAVRWPETDLAMPPLPSHPSGDIGYDQELRHSPKRKAAGQTMVVSIQVEGGFFFPGWQMGPRIRCKFTVLRPWVPPRVNLNSVQSNSITHSAPPPQFLGWATASPLYKLCKTYRAVV